MDDGDRLFRLSLPAKAGNPVNSSASDFGIKIVPIRIILFDKRNLPGTRPLFQTLLPTYCVLGIVELFVTDEAMNFVSLRKSAHQLVSVLIDATSKVACNADVKCSSEPARKYVHPVAFSPH